MTTMLLSARSDASLAPPEHEADPSRRTQAGLFLVVVAAPLIVTPVSRAPFVDAKLVAVLAGTLLLWAARSAIDRRIGALALAFMAVVAAAGIAGVDPGVSLLGSERQGTGVALLVACAALAALGTGLDRPAVARIRGWIVAVGVIAGLLGLVEHAFPSLRPLGLDLAGSTFGHQAFLGALLGAAIVALACGPRPLSLVDAGLLAIMASALSVTANRSGWLGVAGGLVIAAMLVPGVRGRLARATAVLVLVFAAWTALDLAVPGTELSPTTRFGHLGAGSARDRLDVWPAMARAIAERPVSGWGPGNSWGAYLGSATHGEVAAAGRHWADAHDLVLEVGVAAGALGVLALVALLAATAVPAVRRRGAPWAAAVAGALLVPHLFQPLNVAVTPLLFLLLGVAAGAAAARPVRPGARAAVAVVLVLVCALAGVRLVASSFERYGRTYADAPALRAALILDPARVSAAEALTLHLAFDGERDADAARRAVALAAATVARHPWSPTVRLVASDAAILGGDLDEAARWLEEHLARFPNDPLAMAKRSFVAFRAGDRPLGERWARRAVALDPDSPAARLLSEDDPVFRPSS